MEKRRTVFCAWVNGNEDNLNRSLLKNEFSKFGNVSKIFIGPEITYAKVYFYDTKFLKLACDQLNGVNSWIVKLIQDDYEQHDQRNNFANASHNKSGNSLNTSFGASSNSKLGDMDEECVFAENYVDVHGRPVEVLQSENGTFYVNLDDVRAGGYNIYKKESFENAMISDDIDLRHLENYLLNQGKKFVINAQKKFNEQEVLGVFERVRAKLENKPLGGAFGEGRFVNSSPNTKNFTITKTIASPSAVDTAVDSRDSKTLVENVQPSLSYPRSPSKKDIRSDDRHDRQNGPMPSSSGLGLPHDNSRADRNNVHKNEDIRKPFENNSSFTETKQMRKPRPIIENTRSKAMSNNSVNEESREGEKTTIPKSKPQSEASSGSSQRRNLNLERSILSPGATYKVKVSYTKPDKAYMFYAQWLENLNQIAEILLHVNTKDIELPQIGQPVREMLCIAHFDDCWYRAVVLHEEKQPGTGVFVELIDYGNKEFIKTPLREMSTEMKAIPGMAIRIAVHHSENGAEPKTFDVDQELEVFVKKHISDEYDDQTHLIEIKRVLDVSQLDQDPPSPASELSSDQEQPQKAKAADKPAPSILEDCFMEIPATTAKLTKGESVMIVSYTNENFVLRNKDTAKSCKEVYSHLTAMEKKPIANPKVGQLVLCSRDGVEGMHRAVIKQINNTVADLEYLDYHGGETLTLKSLRNMDKVLASYPAAKLESPVVKWLMAATEKSEVFLSDLIANKTKLKVVLDGSEFDLLLPGGQEILLSKKIDELENPPTATKPVAVSTPSKNEEVVLEQLPSKKEHLVVEKVVPVTDQFVKITYDEMPFAQAKIGEDNYICYNCKEGSVTLMLLSDAEKHLERLITIEPADTVPYEPDTYEMCLAKYSGEWCRAAITDTIGDKYEVQFVDFGNSDVIPKSDIRKFPKDFVDLPILGINAYFMDVPAKPEVYERLKQLIPDETPLTVNVKTDLNDELKHGIEIPEIYETLRKEKLI